MKPFRRLPGVGLRLALVCALAACMQSYSQGAAQSLPNILWITCEDMSADLGCYGSPGARTPNLDRFAAEGTRYTNVYTVAPVCAPSRSCLITGAYPTTIGTHHMRSKAVPPAWVKCFPEYLRGAGYYCTNNVKTDYNFDNPRSTWDQNGKNAHWRNRPKGSPFFSVFNLTITHESKFHMNDAEIERLVPSVPADKRHRPEAAQLPPYYPDTPVVRKDWARHQDLITEMDHQAGKLLEDLQADGLSSNTVVFFFSDHGRGLPRGKRWVYDSGLHVPLIIRWPGRLQPGSVQDRLISFIDFAPSMLGIAGIEKPSTLTGRDFLKKDVEEPRYVFAARDRMDEVYDIIRAVRDRRFKYIRNFEPDKPYAQVIDYGEKTPTMQELRRMHADGKLTGPQTLFFRDRKPTEELYDTLTDPHEVADIAGAPEHQETLKRMRDALAQWQKDTNDLGLTPEPELKERMRPGGKAIVTAAPESAGEPDGKLRLTCKTEGASISYRTDSGSGFSRWKLYTKPLMCEPGTTVSVIASRLGYQDSNETIFGTADR